MMEMVRFSLPQNEHVDHRPYYRFSGPSRLDKCANSLLGLLEGISADSILKPIETQRVCEWIEEQREVRRQHPFSEIVDTLQAALADGILTVDEKKDLIWLCDKLRSTTYFDDSTANMQRLQAVLSGISCDDEITTQELDGLRLWLSEHEDLRTVWPYDEVCSLVTSVMSDGRIDADEHAALMEFFREFTSTSETRTITKAARVEIGGGVTCVCACCPEITLPEKTFCFTGASDRYTRSQFQELVGTLGGSFSKNVTHAVDYLVIGADGNPCWAFACYGRKIEQAVDMRKNGSRIMIVHENDFFDAVEDLK
jgi:NAD-dependent DNA ligase